MDWENSGPSQLDLTAPLVQGEELGQQAAFRRSQIAQEAQRMDLARQNLGLDAKKEAFQETAWNSQAAMRANQLDLGQAQLVTATRNNDNATNDQTALMDVQQQVSDLAAKGDFAGISGLTPTGLKTPEGVAQFHQIVGAGLQTIGGQKFLAQQNQNTATLLEANSLGIPPVRDANGQPDYMATNAAITAQKLKTQAATSAASPEVLSANIHANAMENVAGTRAGASTQNNINTNARNILQTKLKGYQAAVSQGTLTPQEASALSDKAQQDYQAAGGDNSSGGTLNAGGVAIPVPPQQRASGYINSLFSPTTGQ